jgi:glutathione S-transferase
MPNDPDFVLHWFPGTCSRVTLIALEEIGVPFQTQVFRRFEPEAVAVYKRDVNPKGKVPSLVVGGRVLTESPAIQVYLNGRFPEAQLLPEDPDEYLDALVMMSWFAGGVHPAVGRSRVPRSVSADPATYDAIRETAVAQLRDAFAIVENHLTGRDWMFAQRWTIVDGYLLWLWFRGVGSGLKPEEFPGVHDLAQRCQQRPGVARALDREIEALAALEAEGAMPPPPPLQVGRLPN